MSDQDLLQALAVASDNARKAFEEACGSSLTTEAEYNALRSAYIDAQKAHHDALYRSWGMRS